MDVGAAALAAIAVESLTGRARPRYVRALAAAGSCVEYLRRITALCVLTLALALFVVEDPWTGAAGIRGTDAAAAPFVKDSSV